VPLRNAPIITGTYRHTEKRKTIDSEWFMNDYWYLGEHPLSQVLALRIQRLQVRSLLGAPESLIAYD
jgi:hypothetical protein